MGTAPTFNPADVYTLADLPQFFDGDNKDQLSVIINNLVKDDPIMEQILWKQGNMTDGHKHKIVTKIPTPSFRRFYAGATRTKSGVATVKETTSQIVDRWEIDVDELKMYTGSDAQSLFRMQEGERHIQGMREFVANQLFYGNPDANADELRGLSARYNYKDGPNVVDGGGTTGNQTSMWAVVWGATETFGFYPMKMDAGLQHEDLGMYDAFDADNKPFRVTGDEWKWNIGFAVADWQSVARLCNLTVASLSITNPETAGWIDLKNLTIDLKNKIPRRLRSRIIFYAGETLMNALEKQASGKDNVHLRYGEYFDSKEVVMLHGKPVFECDSLLETESVLSALP